MEQASQHNREEVFPVLSIGTHWAELQDTMKERHTDKGVRYWSFQFKCVDSDEAGMNAGVSFFDSDQGHGFLSGMIEALGLQEQMAGIPGDGFTMSDALYAMIKRVGSGKKVLVEVKHSKDGKYANVCNFPTEMPTAVAVSEPATEAKPEDTESY